VRLVRVAAGVFLLAVACRDDRNILTISTPSRVTSFQVADAHGQVLWRFESGHANELSVVHYGEVPSGFEQTVPRGGSSPRPFTPGERLLIETVTETRTFFHDGLATGPTAFRGEGWRAKPRQTPTPEGASS
jgi:hypothetical protein